MSPDTEVRVPITLSDGVQRWMVFNANTMVAYQTATGKFFLNTVADLYAIMQPFWESGLRAERNKALAKAGQPVPIEATSRVSYMDVLRKVSIADLRALLWAALHEYNDKEEPVWSLTEFQVGRLLRPTDIPAVFSDFLKGQAANSPTKAELGESPAPPTKAAAESATKIQAEAGGEPGIDLPVDAFDSIAAT